MLILTRNLGQSIIIDSHIEIFYIGRQGNQIRIGINAPPEMSIHRSEIQEKIDQEKFDHARTNPTDVNDIPVLYRKRRGLMVPE